jgi:mRNA-degrading endonuclease RelE of RelBE toxin-antitoxin system
VGKVEKLLRKIDLQDGARLLLFVEKLITGTTKDLSIMKLKGTAFYRLRPGRFRIILHKESKTKGLVIDSIKIRNTKT